MIKLYSKYHFNISKHGEKKSGKLIFRISPSPRSITLQKIIEPEQNINLICNMSWWNCIPNIIWISRSMTKKSPENWFFEFPQVQLNWMVFKVISTHFRLFNDEKKSGKLIFAGRTDWRTDWRTECKPNSPLRQAGRVLITKSNVILEWNVDDRDMRYVDSWVNIYPTINGTEKERWSSLLWRVKNLVVCWPNIRLKAWTNVWMPFSE